MTMEFRAEFEAQLGSWLRKRFLWYAGVVLGLNTVGIVLMAGFLALRVADGTVPFGQIVPDLVAGALSAIPLLYYAWAFLWVRKHALSRERTLTLAVRLVLVTGVFSLLASVVTAEVLREFYPARFDDQFGGLGVGPGIAAANAFQIFAAHFFACLFLPWTSRESLKPVLPLLALNAALAIVYGWGLWLATALVIVLSPLVAVPGMLICWWRHSRFRNRFHFNMLRARHQEMKRELVDARRIHESLFPLPLRSGPLLLDYRYEPMRQIGGDYLFAKLHAPPNAEQPVLSAVIVDVTGHGISAALTVNRLQGEIERQFGKRPDLRPGRLLHGLNAYLHYALSDHSVFATAICVRIDPNTNSITWASAGHPPAFLRTIDGRIERIESTTIVLGACGEDEFEPQEAVTAFHPGDTLIAYTDGATEAIGHDGKMLRIDGMQRLVAALGPNDVADEGWSAALLAQVDRFRHGPLRDDTLVVEFARPLRPSPTDDTRSAEHPTREAATPSPTDRAIAAADTKPVEPTR
jgi:serine phosphatase RsbU (regulator of sigma subunit)